MQLRSLYKGWIQIWAIFVDREEVGLADLLERMGRNPF